MTESVTREAQAMAHIHGICLKTGPPGLVGVELEWLVRDAADPALPVPAERIAAAVASLRPAGSVPAPARNEVLPSNSAPGFLPSGALLTAEPGGQLELSSLPADSLADLVSVTRADMAVLRAAVAAEGLTLAGIGLDPLRPPRRLLRMPRYAAMEEFFDRGGPWGRRMMCGTASVQVCLDAGDDGGAWTDYRYRWRLLHAIGPVLVAAFANSPLLEGRVTGWRSSRQQVWAHMDAGRTRPPHLADNGDLRAGWAAYAMDAAVMCVRSDGPDWSAPERMTLRDWTRGSGAREHNLRAADEADLDYHLSTLFPPIRPRGHFEIRMIDAQPGDGWIVPLAVTSALLADERAGADALVAAGRIWPGPPGDWPDDPGAPGHPGAPGISQAPGISEAGGGSGAEDGGTDNPWLTAARLGPADPGIARASRECFAAARAALDRMNAPESITRAVDTFTETYVDRGRCPADDLLQEEAR